MTERAVAIALKIPDNEAYTALTALRALGVAVERLERSDVWRLRDAGEASTVALRVESDESIFNPNKHRLHVLPGLEPRAGEAWIYELAPAGGDEPIARPRMGAKRIEGIDATRRFVGWRLLDAGGNPVERSVVAAAVEKLLCNPAIEKALYA